MSGVVVVIPARMASTRFPGKPLIDLCGKPMLAHVVDRVRESEVADDVLIATPDEAIAEFARGYGVEVAMTRDDHPSGTDRIAEALSGREFEFAVNVQGDEPLLDPRSIVALVEGMRGSPDTQLGTLWTEATLDDVYDPAVVKVVTTPDDRALYFSRHSIPYPRGDRPLLKRHLGIYAYRPESLAKFAAQAPTPLEATEGLEQLRFLEMGLVVRAWRGFPAGTAVDTPEQAETVRRTLETA